MKKYLLVLICLFFLITRLYKIGEIPVSVYWDEASIGYNAYSIVETGKDEWGEVLPLHFRAFGEFKLPVYIYTTAISVKLFGLNEFSVRFPAVLFSLGVIILTFFLGKKFSGNTSVGLLSSFLLSISPWFFIFSRTGYEVTAGLMFYLLGIYLFLNYKKNTWFIFFSILSFILSAYSYNSFRIIAPISIFILIILYLKDLRRSILPIIFSAIILGASIIPIYRNYFLDNGAVRLKTVAASPSAYIKNYLSHFNPVFLFISGDTNLRSQQAGFGQLFIPEALFLLLGFIFICRKPKKNILLIVLALLAPIPAALTRESPHALRALSVVPFISIISAIGASYFKKYYLIIILVFLTFFINYFANFLSVYPLNSSEDWQYQYKKIYTDYGNEFEQYKRIIVSDKYAQPYIFALFYLKYDPDKFRQEVVRNSVDQWGFSTVGKFGKFEFEKSDTLVSFIK